MFELAIFDMFQYGFMQCAIIAATLIGISTGLLAPYLVLRRLSLVGDGLAHLAFGGVAVGLLFSINPLISALGVIIAGSLMIRTLIKKQIYGEAAIAITLSLGIGLGVVIIGATQGFGVDLFSYFIGSILAVRWFEIILLALLTLAIITFMYIFRSEMFLLTFQQDIAYLASKRTRFADVSLFIIIAFATIMTIQAVGILLVSALLVIPGLIALKLSTSFKSTIIISIAISTSANVLGVIGSYYADVPPSGFIVLSLVAVYLLLLFLKK